MVNYIKVNICYCNLVLDYFCLSCAYELCPILVCLFILLLSKFILNFFCGICLLCGKIPTLQAPLLAVVPLFLRHSVYVLDKWHILTHWVSSFSILVLNFMYLPFDQVTLLVFLVMLVAAVLIWIGRGRNPIDSSVVARVWTKALWLHVSIYLLFSHIL